MNEDVQTPAHSQHEGTQEPMFGECFAPFVSCSLGSKGRDAGGSVGGHSKSMCTVFKSVKILSLLCVSCWCLLAEWARKGSAPMHLDVQVQRVYLKFPVASAEGII